MTRLVDASRKARDGARPAPLENNERVLANAAKEQELEMKPNRVPSAMLRGPDSPMLSRMRWRVTNT